MSFPFDNEDHPLIIGESCNTLLGHKSKVQYTSVKYDYKPHRIDYDKQGILETSDAACWIRLPLVEEASSTRASSVFKGNRQDLSGKECILVIDREAGTITLEHVTSKIDVKQTRAPDTQETHFKPRPARRKSGSKPTGGASIKEPVRKKERHESNIYQQRDINESQDIIMPGIIGMEKGKSPDTPPFGKDGLEMSSESDSARDSSSSSSTSSDESDDSSPPTPNQPTQHSPLVVPALGLDLSDESSDDSDSS